MGYNGFAAEDGYYHCFHLQWLFPAKAEKVAHASETTWESRGHCIEVTEQHGVAQE